jgi:hypothetical protein
VENPVTKARGRQHLKATASSAEKVLLEEMHVLSARVAELESRPTFTYPSGTFGYPTVNMPDQSNAFLFNHSGFMSRGLINTETVSPTAVPLAKGLVRNLNGKPAVIVVADTDTDGTVTVTVEGKEVRLTKEQWEKLPTWNGSFP